MTTTTLDPKYSHKLHYKNWYCGSHEARNELRSVIKNNKTLQLNETGYIGYVPPVFHLNSDHILPDELSGLQGAVVEVSALVLHEKFGSGDNRSNNFFFDISYINVLQNPPPPPHSPNKKRGLLDVPSLLMKRPCLHCTN